MVKKDSGRVSIAAWLFSEFDKTPYWVVFDRIRVTSFPGEKPVLLIDPKRCYSEELKGHFSARDRQRRPDVHPLMLKSRGARGFVTRVINGATPPRYTSDEACVLVREIEEEAGLIQTNDEGIAERNDVGYLVDKETVTRYCYERPTMGRDTLLPIRAYEIQIHKPNTPDAALRHINNYLAGRVQKFLRYARSIGQLEPDELFKDQYLQAVRAYQEKARTHGLHNEAIARHCQFLEACLDMVAHPGYTSGVYDMPRETEEIQISAKIPDPTKFDVKLEMPSMEHLGAYVGPYEQIKGVLPFPIQQEVLGIIDEHAKSVLRKAA